jgi:hypothetical protein
MAISPGSGRKRGGRVKRKPRFLATEADFRGESITQLYGVSKSTRRSKR